MVIRYPDAFFDLDNLDEPHLLDEPHQNHDQHDAAEKTIPETFGDAGHHEFHEIPKAGHADYAERHIK